MNQTEATYTNRAALGSLALKLLLVSSGTLCLFFFFQIGHSQAQTLSPTTAEDPASAAAIAPLAEQTGQESNAPDRATTPQTSKPPLPFRGPQISPLIKRVSMENIEHRTTAFLPQSTEALNLTPVQAPAEEKWIHVDLSEQLVVAYQDGVAQRAFVISSGLARTPTVKGEFRIRTKVREQTMYGGEGAYAYHLPGVEWVQYFYEDYSFHGTYWHSNFGSPMSHGCINMTNADAKWLFDWAGPTWDGETIWYKGSPDNLGTLVIVTE